MKRSQGRGQRIIFGTLSLLVVLSMALSLILTVTPQRKQPTPTVRSTSPLLTPRLVVTPTPRPTPTHTLTPTLTPTTTPPSS